MTATTPALYGTCNPGLRDTRPLLWRRRRQRLRRLRRRHQQRRLWQPATATAPRPAIVATPPPRARQKIVMMATSTTSTAAPICASRRSAGDGLVQAGEECDDANRRRHRQLHQCLHRRGVWATASSGPVRLATTATASTTMPAPIAAPQAAAAMASPKPAKNVMMATPPTPTACTNACTAAACGDGFTQDWRRM